MDLNKNLLDWQESMNRCHNLFLQTGVKEFQAAMVFAAKKVIAIVEECKMLVELYPDMDMMTF